MEIGTFQGLAEGDQMFHVFHAHSCDHVAFFGNVHQHPFAAQLNQGFPDGRAADIEFIHELFFMEYGLRLAGAVQNIIEERVVDLLFEALIGVDDINHMNKTFLWTTIIWYPR